MISKKYVVITRPKEENSIWKSKLRKLGLNVLQFPSIAISKNSLPEDTKQHIQDISSFDWILFTSKNGVKFFMDALKDLQINKSVLQEKRIAAVGPKTAEEVKKYGLLLHFLPSEFSTEDLAKQLPDINGKKILLPRANIASPLLAELLKKKGAHVTNIPIYITNYIPTKPSAFERLLQQNEILCITFTSPSTVEGFLKNVEHLPQEQIHSLPALAIGPVTANALKKQGFQKVYMADTFTTEGMITKLQESIL